MAESAIEPYRRHARRALFAFLAISVAVHAAVLVVIPPLAHGPEPARAGVLEVVVLQPEPLLVAPAEFTPPFPQRESQPQRRAAVAEPKPQPERQSPVEFPEPRPAVDSAFVTSPTRTPEPAAPASERKAKVATTPVTPPSFNAAYLSNPTPRYPLAARRAGEQGTVTLRVLVTHEGLAGRVEIEKPSGSPYLDAAAQEAVKAWRFTPARKGEETIESWMLVPIVFRLEGAS